MRKRLSVIILVFVMALNCFSCVTVLPTPPLDYEVDISIPYDIEGSLKIGITPDAKEAAIIDALIKGYNEMYPNVAVNYEKIAGKYNSTLISYHNAEKNSPGTMPDILFSNSSDMAPMVANSLFLNIQPYITNSVAKGKLNLSDFYENMFKLGQKSFDGDQYLIPRSSDRVVTHINKKIFEDCFRNTSIEDMPYTVREGTKLPANGWTWNEFLATCDALRKFYDSDKQTSVLYLIDSYINWEAVFNPIFLSNGVTYFDEKGNINLSSPQTIAALGMMKNLVTKRFMAPMTSSTQANYEGGQGAMMFHSSPAALMKASLGEDYDLTTFPLIGNNPKIGTGVPGYSIYGYTKKRDLAWTFLNYILTQDGQNSIAKGGATTPPMRKDLKDPKTNAWGKGYEDINLEAYVYRNELDVATSFQTKFDISIQADIVSALKEMIGDALTDKTFEEAIAICNDNIKYFIETM